MVHIIGPEDNEFEEKWRELLLDAPTSGALYSNENINYYIVRSEVSNFEDISFIVLVNGNAIAGLRALRYKRLGSYANQVSCIDIPALFIESTKLASDSTKSIKRAILKIIIEKLGEKQDNSNLWVRDLGANSSLTFLTSYALANNASAELKYTQVIDLCKKNEEIHRDLTKSLRWGINWGYKNCEINSYDEKNITESIICEFEKLHAQAAGRSTRSQESWRAQYLMIKAKKAFCITARKDDRLVSASLFLAYSNHSYYGVSASDRTLFDKPISHVVIWEGIMAAKARGCHKFEMGEQVYPYQAPSKKELGISYFKKSFGGTTNTFLDLNYSF